MKARMHRQIRAIRRYAKAVGLSLEAAAMRWVERGHAARWAEQN